MRQAFQFKQFSIRDENSAMKVGTDAVLLGAWVNPETSNSILDIGTGTGIIALMMAQKSTAKIDAIDIDVDSIQEAAINFHNSPWVDNLQAIHTSLSDYVKRTGMKYDLLLSNPPFFNNSLKSPSDRKNLSKHTSTLTHEYLLLGVRNLISPAGKFAVIIPFNQMDSFSDYALMVGLYCSNKLTIYPTPIKPANRIMMLFSLKKENQIINEELTIREASGKFSDTYKALTKDFYLNF